MNKFTKKLLLIAGTLTVLLLLQVFTYAEVRSLMKMKLELQRVKKERLNKLEAKAVEVQRLSSEERINKIASESLRMRKSGVPYPVVEVSNYEIEQIQKIIEDKYE